MPTAHPRTDAVTLHSWRDDRSDVCLLDVRTPGEHATAHIPSSCNVPLNDLADHASALAAITSPVVIVCRSGARAAKAHAQLAEAGLATATVLDGGMLAWDDGSRPVRRERERWDLERQVRLVAGALVTTGVALSLKLPRAKYLAGAIGIGLSTAALTNTCAMGALLARLPYNRPSGTDVGAVVGELTARSRP